MKAEYIIVLSDASLNIIEASSYAEARAIAQSFVAESHVRIVAIRKV